MSKRWKLSVTIEMLDPEADALHEMTGIPRGTRTVETDVELESLSEIAGFLARFAHGIVDVHDEYET